MPLDTGSVTPEMFAQSEATGDAQMKPPVDSLVLSHGAHLGEGFRAARQARKFRIEDIAEYTRVRPQHIEALEAMDIGGLPSRPFAIGYVRAYARFLGVDEEKALDRFKADAPECREQLRPPVGVGDDSGGDPRLALIIAGMALILGAIIVWNVAQRAMADKEPAPPPVVQGPPPIAAIPKGPVVLGEALPAPVESTIPKPYITPGLGPVDPTQYVPDPTLAKPVDPSQMLPPMRVTNPNAAIFGAAPNQAIIALRARKSVALIVSSPTGVVFTRVLAKDEAYRVPNIAGLSFDVSDPTGFDVYVHNQFVGQLPAPVTPVSKVASMAPKIAPGAAPIGGAAAPPAPVAAPVPGGAPANPPVAKQGAPAVNAAPAPKLSAPAPKVAAPAPKAIPAPKTVAPTPKAPAAVAPAPKSPAPATPAG